MGREPRLETVCYNLHLWLVSFDFSQCILKFSPEPVGFASVNERLEYWGSYVAKVQKPRRKIQQPQNSQCASFIPQPRLMQESMANFGKCDSWCAVTVRNLKYERPSGGNPSKCPISSNENWELEAIVSLHGFVFVSPSSSGLASAGNGKASVLTLTFHSKLDSRCKKIRTDSWCSVVRLTKALPPALVCELRRWAPAIVKVQRCVTTLSTAPA